MGAAPGECAVLQSALLKEPDGKTHLAVNGGRELALVESYQPGQLRRWLRNPRGYSALQHSPNVDPRRRYQSPLGGRARCSRPMRGESVVPEDAPCIIHSEAPVDHGACRGARMRPCWLRARHRRASWRPASAPSTVTEAREWMLRLSITKRIRRAEPWRRAIFLSPLRKARLRLAVAKVSRRPVLRMSLETCGREWLLVVPVSQRHALRGRRGAAVAVDGDLESPTHTQ